MYVSNQLTPTQVWGAASKVLTSLGPACLTGTGADSTAIGAAATVAFSTSGTDEQMVTVVGLALASVTYNLGTFNGVTFRQGQAGVSAASVIFTGVGNSSFQLAINNSGASTGNYAYASMRFH